MKTALTTPGKVMPIAVMPEKEMFREMMEMTDRIAKRAYEMFAGRGFMNGHDLEDWFAAEREFLKPVPLELKDAKDELIVRAEVPGFEAKDLTIKVEGMNLVIRGKRETTKEEKEKEGKTVYTERKAEEIYRLVPLPVMVMPETAKAEINNGVLELTLPKAAKPRNIKVAAA